MIEQNAKQKGYKHSFCCIHSFVPPACLISLIIQYEYTYFKQQDNNYNEKGIGTGRTLSDVIKKQKYKIKNNSPYAHILHAPNIIQLFSCSHPLNVHAMAAHANRLRFFN